MSMKTNQHVDDGSGRPTVQLTSVEVTLRVLISSFERINVMNQYVREKERKRERERDEKESCS